MPTWVFSVVAVIALLVLATMMVKHSFRRTLRGDCEEVKIMEVPQNPFTGNTVCSGCGEMHWETSVGARVNCRCGAKMQVVAPEPQLAGTA